MSDPAETCTNCGARRDAHKPASNGGLDCPPREDGKVPMIVGHHVVGMNYEEQTVKAAKAKDRWEGDCARAIRDAGSRRR